MTRGKNPVTTAVTIERTLATTAVVYAAWLSGFHDG